MRILLTPSQTGRVAEHPFGQFQCSQADLAQYMHPTMAQEPIKTRNKKSSTARPAPAAH
jgi:hypothetical protein